MSCGCFLQMKEKLTIKIKEYVFILRFIPGIYVIIFPAMEILYAHPKNNEYATPR